jgi:peroxiredoxin
MSKAQRLRAERRKPQPVGKQAASSRVIWAVTGGVALVVAVVVGILLATRSSLAPPPAASSSAADQNAPTALVHAADAVGFEPTTEPGVGQIEDQPASAAASPSNTNLLSRGTQAPGFTLKTPAGPQVSLSAFKGEVVLLEFFATWCPHCNAEAPHLQRLWTSLDHSRYAFVSVNADGEDAASVFAYHRYFGLRFPALLDPSSKPGSFHQPGAAGRVTTSYRVGSYPTFYILDPTGKITWRSDGEQPDALLRQELQKAAGA